MKPRIVPALVVLPVAFVVFALWLPGGDAAFLSFGNARLIALQSVPLVIGSLGMMLVMAGRGADLGAGGAMTLAGALAAMLAAAGMGPRGIFPVLLLGGIAAGMFNGAMTRAAPGSGLVITFLAGALFQALARLLPEAQAAPPPIQEAMALFPPFPWPWFAAGFWGALLLVLCVGGVLRHTLWGHHLLALGSNEEAARLCGIRVGRTRFFAMVAAGVLYAVAGGLLWGAKGSVEPENAPWLTLDLVSAALLGGAALEGGRAPVGGVVLGAVTVALVRNGVALAGGHRTVADLSIALLALGVLRLRASSRQA